MDIKGETLALNQEKVDANTNANQMNQIPQPNTVMPMGTISDLRLPFNVTLELNQFTKIYVSKQIDPFRYFCCLEPCSSDYIIYGELPDGSKQLLFTARRHYQCCRCCEDCSIGCLCLCRYYCCNSIVYQVDYKKNNVNFYTQGFNIQKGCYCCKCFCCLCMVPSILYLRENYDADNPDFDVGVKKGLTDASMCCCCLGCQDRKTTYFSQEGAKGHNLRLNCCDYCLLNCLCCCKELEIDIEDSNEKKVGNIFVPSNCCSIKAPGCSYCNQRYYEINMPANATSEQKFQIITTVVHFDLFNTILK